MSLIRKGRDAGEVWKSHVVAKMKEPHCWVCTQAVREVDRDFFWFACEQYYEPEVIDKMRLAHGFCPTHTRHFLQTVAPSVITTVFSYLTWHVVRRLNAARDLLVHRSSKQDPRQLCLQAATVLRSQGICPMCQSLRQSEEIDINALVHGLSLSEVRDGYGHSPGLCLPHFRQAGYRAEWSIVSFLTTDLQRRLSAKMLTERSTTALLEQAVGLDREKSLRRGALSRELTQPLCAIERGSEPYIELGKPEPLWSPTFEQLLASLAEPGCPVCRACEHGVRHYLDWLALQMETQPLVGSWDFTWHVCPTHLWDLYAAGHDRAAILIGKRTIHEWILKLDKLAAGLSTKPAERSLERLRQGFLVWCGYDNGDSGQDPERPQPRWRKVAAVLESPQARLDALRAVAFRTDLCQACTYIHTITQQRLDLILRALEDPAGRKAYHAGWGLCLRHCVEAANLADVPMAMAELLSAQIARLRILEWELEEASRKENWSVRYEPKGPEKDAWRRAAYQFCGV